MINRQILMVRDKKRRRGGGRERLEKDTFAFFCWGTGHIHPLLSPSLLLPTTLLCQNINHNLYNPRIVECQPSTKTYLRPWPLTYVLENKQFEKIIIGGSYRLAIERVG
ncbi:hypothetical protein [Aneurinibacillus migulanus]|uniref:hypothetical protein n=1 Tax=Aneurinibacillus migulanus TaxID=47500 RepID=UPI001F1F8CE2|nr:hypothetical protein [Aneurinibacillus migulanus]